MSKSSLSNSDGPLGAAPILTFKSLKRKDSQSLRVSFYQSIVGSSERHSVRFPNRYWSASDAKIRSDVCWVNGRALGGDYEASASPGHSVRICKG